MKKIKDIAKFHLTGSGVEAYTNYHDNSTDWIDDRIAEEYLKKYYLTRQDQDRCNLTQESVFYLDRQLPNMIFKKSFEFITLLGGAMFEQKDFEQFKSCLQHTGDRHFLIVQDTLGMSPDEIRYSLKMKYPSNIGWDKLMSGNFISTILFEPFYNHYYVFGESGEWGMYVANEGYKGDQQIAGEPAPIRLIGFDPKHREIFRDAFNIQEGEYCECVVSIPEDERPDLKKWVPEVYRN